MTKTVNKKANGAGKEDATISQKPRGRGNPNGAAHLKEHQFKPGQSGNPTGRPKATILSSAYRNVLQRQAPADLTRAVAPNYEGDATFAELIAEASIRGAIKAAVKGDPRAAKELADRTEGKARQTVEIARPDPTGVTRLSDAELEAILLEDDETEESEAVQ